MSTTTTSTASAPAGIITTTTTTPTSWGKETAHKYSREDLDKALHALDEGAYGMILRAKGIVDGGDTWYEFDMVPGEHEIRPCGPDVTGKLCVIGSQLKEHEIAELFHV